MAKLSNKQFDFPDLDFSVGLRDGFKAQLQALTKLQQASETIDFENPKASLKGAMLRWQRADGYAYYIVTEDRPLTVAHLPFGDAWSVEPALIRGLTRADVINQLRQAKALRQLFSKSPEPKQA